MTKLTTTIYGSCFCQRNKYTITAGPTDLTLGEEFGPPPYIYYDHCYMCRKLHTSLLTGWIRAPLSWYNRTTHPQSPSESADEIYKHMNSSPGIDRNFCGFCGTHLMFLSEPCRKEGWVEVPLGSVDQESLEKLDEMGLKPDTHFYWGSGVSWLKRDLIQATAKEEPKFWDGEVDQLVEGDALARCLEHGKTREKE